MDLSKKYFLRRTFQSTPVRTGIGLGWFLVVLMIVLWRAQSKREDEEWERRERERYARQEELETQKREIAEKQRQHEERSKRRRKRIKDDD